MRDISISYKDGSTLYGADAILEQYEIALFTIPGEFSADPTFGIGIQQFVDEINNQKTAKAIRQFIIAQTNNFFPEIGILNIFTTRNVPSGTLTINIDLVILPYNKRTTLRKEISND